MADGALQEALNRERTLSAALQKALDEVTRLRGPGPLENAWREVEAEEESMSNSMRRRLDEKEREKLIISRALDAENEAICNRLSRDVDGLRGVCNEWASAMAAFDSVHRPTAGPEGLRLLDALAATAAAMETRADAATGRGGRRRPDAAAPTADNASAPLSAAALG